MRGKSFRTCPLWKKVTTVSYTKRSQFPTEKIYVKFFAIFAFVAARAGATAARRGRLDRAARLGPSPRRTQKLKKEGGRRPNVQASGRPGVRASGRPSVRTSERPDVRASGRSGVRTSERPSFRASERRKWGRKVLKRTITPALEIPPVHIRNDMAISCAQPVFWKEFSGTCHFQVKSSQ